MSIAEKLQTIAENEQRVYDKGYSDGFNSAPLDTAQFTTIFKVPNLNVIGRKEVVFNIPLVTNYQNILQQETVNETVEHITINGSLNGTITNVGYLFAMSTGISSDDKTLKRVTLNCDFSKATNYGRTFYWLTALEVIDGIPLDFSSATSVGNVFGGCYALKDFRVVPLSIKVNISVSHSHDLSPETIQSIIDGLATVETAQTLTLHANLKILQSQVDSANAKGWTVAGGTVVSEEEYYG